MSKEMKIIILAVLMIIVGFLGFLCSLAFRFHYNIVIEDKPKPLYMITDIAIDSEGMIYYYLDEYSSIQVYNSEREFLYRISVPSNVFWRLEEQDLIHLIYRRKGEYHSVYMQQQSIISEENIVEEEFWNLLDAFKEEDKTNYSDQEGYQYIVKGRSVNKLDQTGDLVQKIRPPMAPIFPLPVIFYWLLEGAGILTLLKTVGDIEKRKNLKS